MSDRYHINLFWSDEGECWIADVPELTNRSAHDPSPEAALAEVETAISARLAVQVKAGRPRPECRYRPAIYTSRDAG